MPITNVLLYSGAFALAVMACQFAFAQSEDKPESPTSKFLRLSHDERELSALHRAGKLSYDSSQLGRIHLYNQRWGIILAERVEMPGNRYFFVVSDTYIFEVNRDFPGRLSVVKESDLIAEVVAIAKARKAPNVVHADDVKPRNYQNPDPLGEFWETYKQTRSRIDSDIATIIDAYKQDRLSYPSAKALLDLFEAVARAKLKAGFIRFPDGRMFVRDGPRGYKEVSDDGTDFSLTTIDSVSQASLVRRIEQAWDDNVAEHAKMREASIMAYFKRPPLRAPKPSTDYYTDARALSNEGKTAHAWALLSKGAAMGLLDAEGYYDFGLHCILQLQWENARDAFRQALTLKPDFRLAKSGLQTAENALATP